jgi:Zn-dependent alcohol dehydrogenase
MALPIVAGHEAPGIVEEMGPGCTKIKKGDHVVATWMISCGGCPHCRKGRRNLCTGTFDHFVNGMLLDGTSRIRDMQEKWYAMEFSYPVFPTILSHLRMDLFQYPGTFPWSMPV